MHSAHCPVPTVHCTFPTPLPTVHSAWLTAHCTLSTVHCPLSIPHSLLPMPTVHYPPRAHCSLPTSHCPTGEGVGWSSPPRCRRHTLTLTARELEAGTSAWGSHLPPPPQLLCPPAGGQDRRPEEGTRKNREEEMQKRGLMTRNPQCANFVWGGYVSEDTRPFEKCAKTRKRFRDARPALKFKNIFAKNVNIIFQIFENYIFIVCNSAQVGVYYRKLHDAMKTSLSVWHFTSQKNYCKQVIYLF